MNFQITILDQSGNQQLAQTYDAADHDVAITDAVAEHGATFPEGTHDYVADWTIG